MLYAKITEYSLFSSAYGTFTNIDPMLGCTMSLNKFKKILQATIELNSKLITESYL